MDRTKRRLNQKMKIVFITNSYPPQICGVGDYTYHLSQELLNRGFKTRILKLDMSTYADIIKIKPDLVNIQYTPSLYMSACLGLAVVILAFRIKLCGLRCITTFHERYRGLNSNPKLALLALIERINFLLIAMASESVVFCAQHWVKDFRSYSSWMRKRTYYLPVGSNIPCISLTGETRYKKRLELGAKDEAIILGTFGKVNNSINNFYFDTLLNCFENLKIKGYDVILLLIGWPSKENDLYSPYKERIASKNILPLGRLAASQVGEYLNIIDIYLAPFDDGLTARKGTVMAAMHHGLPVISTIGAKTDAVFDSCGAIKLTKPKKKLFLDALIDLAGNSSKCAQLGRAAKSFYEENFSWVRITGEFIKITGN